MKSLDDINILNKMKFFCLENVFFWKKLLFEKNYDFKKLTKTVFLKKKMVFKTKKFCWKKNCCLPKIFSGKNISF